MSQKSSLLQPANSVSQVLIPDRIAYLMAIYLGKLTTMKEYEDMKGAVTRLEHLIGSPEVIQ